MQLPTQNAVSQGKHGAYNAVDFRSVPDVFYYAPEDGTVNAIARNNGDCGYSFNLTGASGQHGFCHNEEVYVTSGQTVKRGQRLAKMGYTGKTIPTGPGGRHLHWTLNRNGAWVYPPDYVNESFNKQGGNMPYIEQWELDDYKKNKEIRLLLEKERDEVLYPFVTDVTKALGIPNTADKGLAQTAVQQLRDKADKPAGELDVKINGTKYVPEKG